MKIARVVGRRKNIRLSGSGFRPHFRHLKAACQLSNLQGSKLSMSTSFRTNDSNLENLWFDSVSEQYISQLTQCSLYTTSIVKPRDPIAKFQLLKTTTPSKEWCDTTQIMILSFKILTKPDIEFLFTHQIFSSALFSPPISTYQFLEWTILYGLLVQMPLMLTLASSFKCFQISSSRAGLFYLPSTASVG